MKRKIRIILSLVLVVALTSSFVYAKEDKDNTWFKERMNYNREIIEETLQDGRISQEEADLRREHMDEMEKFHEEGNFPAGCMRWGGEDSEYRGHGMGMRGFGMRGLGFGMRGRFGR